MQTIHDRGVYQPNQRAGGKGVVPRVPDGPLRGRGDCRTCSPLAQRRGRLSSALPGAKGATCSRRRTRRLRAGGAICFAGDGEEKVVKTSFEFAGFGLNAPKSEPRRLPADSLPVTERSSS